MLTDLIIALVAAVLLFLGGLWLGYDQSGKHYLNEISTINSRDASALKAANDRVAKSDKDHTDAVTQAEKDKAALAASDADARDTLLDRVRDLEGALSRRPVPRPVDPATGSAPAGSVPGSSHGTESGDTSPDPTLAAAINRWNAALKNYVAGCGHDAEGLTGILDIAPK